MNREGMYQFNQKNQWRNQKFSNQVLKVNLFKKKKLPKEF
jgi:hypothetical protein